MSQAISLSSSLCHVRPSALPFLYHNDSAPRPRIPTANLMVSAPAAMPLSLCGFGFDSAWQSVEQSHQGMNLCLFPLHHQQTQRINGSTVTGATHTTLHTSHLEKVPSNDIQNGRQTVVQSLKELPRPFLPSRLQSSIRIPSASALSIQIRSIRFSTAE